MEINWYPGHMAKTKRLIKDVLPHIDVIYEVIDARIPFSSKINDSDELTKNKPRILILAKYDLCDQKETNKWIKYYEQLGYKTITVDLKNNQDYKKIIDATKLVKSKKKIGDVNVLVIGIPNVGKSTLINTLAGKKSQKVENKPGVTKNLVWLNTKYNIKILDTPGILWSKLDQDVALNLAAMTSIKDSVLPISEIAKYILKKLAVYYPDILASRYKINEKMTVEEMFELIGKNIGAFRQGEIDEDRVSMTIINDIKNEKIVNITFDYM